MFYLVYYWFSVHVCICLFLAVALLVYFSCMCLNVTLDLVSFVPLLEKKSTNSKTMLQLQLCFICPQSITNSSIIKWTPHWTSKHIKIHAHAYNVEFYIYNCFFQTHIHLYHLSLRIFGSWITKNELAYYFKYLVQRAFF